MRAIASTVAALPAATNGAIPGIGRRAAQHLARSELSKAIYHPHTSLTERILHDVLSWLTRVYHAASAVPGGWWSAVALTVLAVSVTAEILRMAQAGRRGRSRLPLDAPGVPLRASDHRAQAHGLEQAGDYGAALCARLRAIAAELDERGVLAPSAGRTADEFAAEAGHALPAHATALRDAARLFDEVCYGKRAGTPAGYAQLCDLDSRVTAEAAPAHRADRAIRAML